MREPSIEPGCPPGCPPPDRRPGRPDDGFTLVELLVVMVAMGILAAVAVTAYVGQQEKAQITTVKVDLHNLATAERTYFADHETYGSSHEVATDIDYRTSEGGGAAVLWNTATDFCVAVANRHTASDPTSPLAGSGFPFETYYFDSRVGTPSTTPCTAPPGATGSDGGYWDESGPH